MRGRQVQVEKNSISVLHVIPSLQIGGAEKTLIELLSDPAARRNAAVVVLFGGGALENRLRELGVGLFDLKMSGWGSLFGAIWKLSGILRTEQPNIVQSWLYYGDLISTLALCMSGRRRRTRLLWSVRCSDYRGAEYKFSLRTTIWACARLSHIPDIVIYNSHAGQSTHSARGYRPRRAMVIHNGVDGDRFQAENGVRSRIRREFGWRDNDVVVVMIGRNDPSKGYKIFCDLIARFPNISAVAVGRGTDALPQTDNLTGLGMRRDIPEILAAADFLVSCSLYGEGFPNVVAEAMAAGLAVICADVGDAALILGDSGIVVPPGDIDALGKAFDRLIADPDLRDSLGQKGRERVVSHYPLDKMVREFNDLYGELEHFPVR